MDAEKIRKKIIEEVDKYKMLNPHYKIDGQQFIGTRENQEDTIVCLPTDSNVFACLADGIGGLSKGEVASSIACHTMLEQRFINSFEKSFLVDGFQSADRNVVSYTQRHDLDGCGCTLISVWVENDELSFCSIGDSLLYLYRDGKLKQINRKHNYKLYLDELLMNNQISNNDYQYNLNKKDVVISYIGKGNISVIDYSKEPVKLLKNDIIILCSDGIFGAIDEDFLIEILNKNSNPSTVASSVINIVKMKKIRNQDNASIIVIKKE